jgi:hypothetical protein
VGSNDQLAKPEDGKAYEVYANSFQPMRCSCGAPQCRGLITGDDWRSPAVQRRYAGFFRYIDARIAMLRGER